MDPTRKEFRAMGGYGSFQFLGYPKVVSEANNDIFAEVVRIEGKYSRYLPSSFLSEINAVAEKGGSIDVDGETAQLLDFAFLAHQRSGGAFDITSGILRKLWRWPLKQVPSPDEIDAILPFIGMDKVTWRNPTLSFLHPGMEIDFGGIAKEYAADRCFDLCDQYEIRGGIVELAGDIRIVGPMEDGKGWPIAIRNPFDDNNPLATIELDSGGLATSGDYARMTEIDGVRYSHILNPRTGYPIHGLSSVTVHAPTCLLAGTLATLSMLRGKAGPPTFDASTYPYVSIDSDGKLLGNLMPQSKT